MFPPSRGGGVCLVCEGAGSPGVTRAHFQQFPPDFQVNLLLRGSRWCLNALIYKSSLVSAVGHCPLCSQKRTFLSALSMSALCHKRTC